VTTRRSLQVNFIEYVDDYIVQYTTSTEPGSSGAPVVSEHFTVVAIHHAGGMISEPATKRHYLRNEGIRIAAILEDLRQNAPVIYHRIGN
jgi:V8-like Glu-specific endopeptidase